MSESGNNTESPKCPQCGKSMVWRRVKIGSDPPRWARKLVCPDCEPDPQGY